MNENEMTLAQQTLRAMRRCGHQLHHNMSGKEVNADEVLSCLRAEEQNTLLELLGKCLEAWQKMRYHQQTLTI